MKTVIFVSMFALSLAFVPALVGAPINAAPQAGRQVAEGEALQIGSTQTAEGESLQIGSVQLAEARGSDAFDRMFIRSGEFSVVTIG